MSAPYSEAEVYGPYKRKDGRMHVIAIFPDGTRKTTSYPKYLMEIYLGRYLGEDEEIDHIDRDFTNNSIKNLQVVSRSEHAKLDAIRTVPQAFQCPLCNKEFELSGRRLYDAKRHREQGKAGPFCSKSCAGSYNKSMNLEIKPIEIKHYRLDK